MKVKKLIACVAASAVCAACACGAVACGGGPNATPKNTDPYDIPQDYVRTYYEVFVRSFADGNGDGIGDIKGLIKNLDYLNDGDDSTTADLGINGIWMMPINASPSYHKYDVSDYKSIDDEYGTLDDFDELVRECNKRDIWLQMDLVINHTSREHQWFKTAVAEAKSGMGSPDRGYMSRYKFYRKGTQPNEGKARYCEVAGSSYVYLCNFSDSMPDLNLANTDVRDDIKDIVDFWLERGVRSFRLDAVPWACGYSADDCGEENIEFWTWFNDYCNTKGAEVYGKDGQALPRYCYNVGEVWSSANTVLSYFSTGMTSFNYSLAGTSPYIGYAGVVNERLSAYRIVSELESLQQSALAADRNAILSNFLTNHDNNRSAEFFFGGDKVKIKKAAGLYLLAPGNPYIYYGEEIGAIGTGEDPSKRLPFNWGDKSKGIVTVNPPGAAAQKQELGSWKSQTADPDSILTYYRNAIKLRNRFPEIGRGVISACGVGRDGALASAATIVGGSQKPLYEFNELNEYIAAYTLTWNGKTVLIAHNVSAEARSFTLGAFDGYTVVGTLKADGGSVKLDGQKLTMSGGTVAVLKPAA